MRKQRERHAKAGPRGARPFALWGEAEEGGGREGPRRLKDRILRNLCFFQITVL